MILPGLSEAVSPPLIDSPLHPMPEPLTFRKTLLEPEKKTPLPPWLLTSIFDKEMESTSVAEICVRKTW